MNDWHGPWRLVAISNKDQYYRWIRPRSELTWKIGPEVKVSKKLDKKLQGRYDQGNMVSG